jgi:hypothetical protein
MGWRLAREVLEGSPDMRYREFRVLIALALDGNDDTRQCLPGRELLALHGNCGVRSVDRALSALRQGGHIKQVRRAAPGVRSVYEILPTGATCDSIVTHERASPANNARQNRGKRATATVSPPKSLPKSPPQKKEPRSKRGPSSGESHRAPPCPECGKPFSQENLADPDFRAMAIAGEVIHAECLEADNLRYLRTSSIEQLIEDGAVCDAIAAGIRQPSDFPGDIGSGYLS